MFHVAIFSVIHKIFFLGILGYEIGQEILESCVGIQHKKENIDININN
jgi:hypothetical protein